MLSNIQMLRAIAALLVLLHHALPHYEAMGGDLPWIKHLSQWGFAGVDIFFVISGYIMAYTTFDKPRTLQSAKTFLKHRLARIYLGYWPFFFVMLFAVFYTKNRLESLDIWGSFFLINDNMFELVLPVSWSLSYELYFYILFAITLFLPVKRLYGLIPVFFVVLLSVSYYIHTHPPHLASFFYSHFLLEFFAGVLLYMYKKTVIRLRILPLVLLLGFYAYHYGISHETKNGLLRIATFGTGALMVVLAALIMEKYRLFRAGKLLVSIGDASYTLYLSHLIILQAFYYLGLRDLFTSTANPLLPLLGLISIVLLCITFSLIYYRHIEKPLYLKAVQYGRSS